MVQAMLEVAFAEVEKDVRAKLKQYHEELNVYSMEQLTRQEETLCSSVPELQAILEGFRGEQCLGHLIVFIKERQQENQILHSKVNNALEVNSDRHRPTSNTRPSWRSARKLSTALSTRSGNWSKSMASRTNQSQRWTGKAAIGEANKPSPKQESRGRGKTTSTPQSGQ